MSIIESVKNFIQKCPVLEKMNGFGVDFLPSENDAVSIEQTPTETVIRTFIDGSSERQFVFVLAARLNYSEELRNNIDNSGIFEEFQEWLEQCTENGIFPQLDNRLTPTKIEAMSNGYLFDVNDNLQSARYQIQCRLLYDKEI